MFLRMGFDWDTTDISIMLLAKLAKHMGSARILINNLHIKGDVSKTHLPPSLYLPLFDYISYIDKQCDV